MIRLRLRSGRRRKSERGGYAYGAPPFGYRAVGGELVKIKEGDERAPTEAAALKRIVALRADGLSLRAIASRLEAEKLPPRRGGRWHPKVVASVLERAA